MWNAKQIPSSQLHQNGAVAIACVLVIGIAVIYALWLFRPQPAVRPKDTATPPVVEVLLAKPESYQAMIYSQATVVPRRAINIVAEVSGRVVSVSEYFQDGGFFEADEALLRLDRRDYEYDLLSTQSVVANAERELALELGQARQARREWRDLGSKEANDLFLRIPQVKAAEAALQSAKAAQKQAELDISRTVIRIPFNGRVMSTAVDLGQFVVQGSVVGVVYDSNQVEVRLPLSNAQLALLDVDIKGLSTKNNPAAPPPIITLRADLGGEVQQWQAKITHLDATIDPTTRFFHLIAVVDQPFNTNIHAEPLLVGLFVEAMIPGRRYRDAIQLPSKAVVNNEVFVVDAHNVLQRRVVSTIDRAGETLWIAAVSLAEGELIVISDPRVLRVGMEVTIAPKSPTTGAKQKSATR